MHQDERGFITAPEATRLQGLKAQLSIPEAARLKPALPGVVNDMRF
jgi:hypothetical protein